jgi:hypothetical protein
MIDLVKLILAYVPRFIANLVNAVASPRRFAAHTGVFDSGHLDQALAFFGVSCVVGVAVKAPLYSSATSAGTLAIGDSIWKFTFVCLFTVVVLITWRIVGARVAAGRYFVAHLYYLSVLAVVAAAAAVSTLALAKINPDLASFYGPACMLALSIWCVGAWRAYVDIAGVSVIRSLVASAVALLLALLQSYRGFSSEACWQVSQRMRVLGSTALSIRCA